MPYMPLLTFDQAEHAFPGQRTMIDAVTTSAYLTYTSGNILLADGVTVPPYANLSVTGTVAYTVPNGIVNGQVLELECTVAATTPQGTVTITTPAGSEPATHVFNAVGQILRLVWTGTGWHCIGKVRAGATTVVVGTTVLTGFDMNSVYNLSVTGTVSSTGTKALPNGLVQGEVMLLRTTVAASIPVGNINATATTVPGVAATNFAGINATTCTAQCVWDGASWQAIVLNTLTLS